MVIKILGLNIIKRMTVDPQYFIWVMKQFCLMDLKEDTQTNGFLTSHINFAIIEIIYCIHKRTITLEEAKRLIDKLEALESATDMLDSRQIIEKVNREIIEEKLGIKNFNKVGYICEDL